VRLQPGGGGASGARAPRRLRLCSGLRPMRAATLAGLLAPSSRAAPPTGFRSRPLVQVLPMNTGVEGGETAIKLARRWG
jgi:hypothetical protein